jgi:hypothetical protein
MNTKLNKIDISKLRDNINLFLFEEFNYSIDKLKLCNQLCNILGDYINEKIDIINNSN